MLSNTSRQPEETEACAKKLLRKEKDIRCFCLFGELGSGKTTFVKGLGAFLGISKKNIKSPTFVLMNRYRGKKGTLYHFDCYRAEAVEELFDDLQEVIEKKNSYVAIEWADRVKAFLPKPRIEVYCKHAGNTKRKITIKKVS